MQRPTGDGPRRSRPSRAWAFVRALLAECGQDRVLGLAAETAFFAVLSIFPGLLIAVSLLGVLDLVVGADVAAGAKETVVAALDTVLTDEAGDVVAAVEALFEEGSGKVLTFATVVGLVTLSGAFAVVINALNLAYDTIEQRSWLRQRLLGLLIGVATMIAVVFALAVLVVGPFLGRGADLAYLVGLGSAFSFAWDVLRVPAIFLGLVVWAMALFRFAPNRHVRWRESVPGAFLTAVGWIVASLGLHAYVVLAAGANAVLGAFGGGAIVMIWVYLLSLALLLGGELNATLHSGQDRRQGPGDGTRTTGQRAW